MHGVAPAKKGSHLTEAQQKLLSRVLSSRRFSCADSLKRVLQYVCDSTAAPGAPTLKEHAIATEALGRPVSFDPRLDPIVRVTMTQIRERLREYFETEGQNEPLSLEIPKGQYRVLFHRSERAELPGPEANPARQSSALRRFWAPYLESGMPNIVLHTEPLFFRDEANSTYIRNLHVNDRKTGLDQLKALDPNLAGREMAPCFHYLSSGEVYCMFSLNRMFQELHTALEMRNSRICFWNEVRNSNLILLGCTRTNSFMDSLQGEGGFVMTPDSIDFTDPRSKEPVSYRAARRMDGKLNRLEEYALVSRRPGPATGCTVTTIASNHGNAVYGAGYFLTLEDRVTKLLNLMQLRDSDPVPSEFQIIMRVDMIEVDDEVVNVEYVAHRTPER
jgi:hypothetical protein